MTFKLGEASWNKGLTKESDSRLSLSDETRARMSMSAKGKVKTAEHKMKISESNKGKHFGKRGHLSDETKMNMSHAQKGHLVSEETREKISAKNRAYFESHPEKREVLSRRMALTNSTRKQKWRETLPEKLMEQILIEMELVYEKQKWIGRTVTDFLVHSRGRTMSLYVDGCYWHGCHKHYQVLNNTQREVVERDREVESYLDSLGIPYLRFSECEIERSREDVRSRLMSALGES